MGRLTGLAYTKGGTNLFTALGWSYDSLTIAGMRFGGGNDASDLPAFSPRLHRIEALAPLARKLHTN
jgi:hypothetical protein